MIKSISGIRGTIGGSVGDSFTPIDIVKFTSAYAKFILDQNNTSKKIIVGRDARISGKFVSDLVCGTLVGCGFDVIDVGLSTTPTIEVSVQREKASGGIILTASHNPKQWNALKLLNNKGEFISSKDGLKILELAEKNDYHFSTIDKIGSLSFDNSQNDKHIEDVLNLNLVNIDLIKSKNFKVVVDAVNSTGGILVPKLLEKLGVECIKLYCDPNGEFPHNPEPLPENLQEISKMVISTNSDLGIVVDPDVDRLALVCEDGSMFGEEYTLVSVSDYVLSKTPGNTVSNLSSTRALADITNKYNCEYHASAVGEVNVVEKMKLCNAVIGGEGNGGVIYPELHYGRDALVGIALFLSNLAEKNISSLNLRNSYPNYFISKNKLDLNPNTNVDYIFSHLKNKYSKNDINLVDGLKIDFDSGWVHLRRSNTEPIIRIYSESSSEEKADELAMDFVNQIKKII